jgi:hypothetical protein
MIKNSSTLTLIVSFLIGLTQSITHTMEKKKPSEEEIETTEKSFGKLLDKEREQRGLLQAIREALEEGAQLTSYEVESMSNIPTLGALNLFFELGANIDPTAIEALFELRAREVKQDILHLSEPQPRFKRFIRWIIEHGYHLPYSPSLAYALTQVSFTSYRLMLTAFGPYANIRELFSPATQFHLLSYPWAPMNELVKPLVAGDKEEITPEKIKQLSKKRLILGKINKHEQAIINDALIIAVAQGYTDVVRTILQLFKPIIEQETIQEAFINAALGNHTGIAWILLDSAEILSKDKNIPSGWKRALGKALVIAAANGKANSVNLILDHLLPAINPLYIRAALIRATRQGHFTIAQRLLDLIIERKAMIEEKTWPDTLVHTLGFAALQGDADNLEFFNHVLSKAIELQWNVDTQQVVKAIDTFLKNRFLSEEKRKTLEVARNTIKNLTGFIKSTARRYGVQSVGQTIQSLLSGLPSRAIAMVLTYLARSHLKT